MRHFSFIWLLPLHQSWQSFRDPILCSILMILVAKLLQWVTILSMAGFHQQFKIDFSRVWAHTQLISHLSGPILIQFGPKVKTYTIFYTVSKQRGKFENKAKFLPNSDE
jgi:hypothetical protein